MSVERAAALLAPVQTVCVFSGAGISVDSGIATFRDVGGLWDQYPLETFGTPGGLLKTAIGDPALLIDFLLDVVGPIAAAEPNPGHAALAELAQVKELDVVTQNVDGLHQAAGNERVWEVHGSLFEIVDGDGEPLRRLSRLELEELVDGLEQMRGARLALVRLAAALRPLLGIGPMGIAHRPNIVLFGEAMAEPAWSHAQRAAADCDAMIVVGTSAETFPAALLPEAVSSRGRPVIGIGPEPGTADVWLEGGAVDLLPALANALRQ